MHLPKEPRSSPSGLSLVPAASLKAGELINERFRILEPLGRGAMGTVYRVEQVFIKKQFALKVLNGLAMSSNTIRRFQNEAEAAARLDHPSLAKAIDFGLIDRHQPYIVMDLVQGETLAQCLKSKGKLDWQQALSIFIQVFDAMAHAHEHGVIHRDIKPSNIVLTQAEDQHTLVPKVVDFGIAKLELDQDSAGSPLTRTGEVFGTPMYMSPEQCSGTRVDNRSDIYALGCVLFETLTGCPPFTADSALETMIQHKISPAPTLKEASLGLTFPKALEAVINRLLAKEPRERYQNCREAASDLSDILHDKISNAEARTTWFGSPPKPRVRLGRQSPNTVPAIIAIVSLAAFVLAITLINVFYIQSSDKSRQAITKKEQITAIDIQATQIESLSRGQNPPIGQSVAPQSQSSNRPASSSDSDGAFLEGVMTVDRNMVRRFIELTPERFSFPPSQGKLEASDLEPLRSDSALTYCNLNWHPELKGDDVIQYLPSESLHGLLMGQSNLTNQGIKEIGDRLSQVDFLDLTQCQRITDLRPLGQLRMLTELRVTGDEQLLPSWVGPHKPTLPGLKVFDAAFGGMSDSSLPYVESLPSLQRLGIAGNGKISDQSGVTLSHCHSLSDLDISGMPITDAMLEKIQHLKLVKLNLRKTKVTKGGVMKLMKNMPTLKCVILESTLNEDELEELRQQFPKCEISNKSYRASEFRPL